MSITEMQRERAVLATEAAALIAKIQATPKADPRRAEHVDRKMLVDRKLKRINADIKRWNVTHSPGTVPTGQDDGDAPDEDPSWIEPGPSFPDAKDLCAIAAMHALISRSDATNGPRDPIWQRDAARSAWEMAEQMFPDDDAGEDGQA